MTVAVDHDGYAGPVELVVGDASLTVRGVLSGQFDPLAGRFRWYGRLGPEDRLGQAPFARAREACVRTSHGTSEATLGDVDPWGRRRVQGFGAPPFPLT